MSIVLFTSEFHPSRGRCVRLMTGRPSKSSTPALNVTNWKRSGTNRMSTISFPTSFSIPSMVR
ncbi:MAG: hypothetical protein IPL90_18350 [Holophagales bacterium]|nr:hypothetical protein [Holophagales bacterium]